ncbi:hypothetical protein [Xylanimonas sp. McL0601]|uniref:hypothetical protein n=1 Tax=Xylanimonas sp. McL0601 TaxID=3414739 RepID=UPI003CE90570
MSVWTPDLPLPRWLAFAEPARTWIQLRRDLAALTAELDRDLADGPVSPCPAA